jgi:hypothetical protein
MLTNDPRIDRLKTYRLDESLSFRRLAERMTDAGFFIRPRALHLALTGGVKTKPRETTLHNIARFLDAADAAKRRQRQRRPKAAIKRKKLRRAAA